MASASSAPPFAAPPSANATCPRCGAPFVCGLQAGLERCWCADLPATLSPDPAATGCYCRECLTALSSARDNPA